MKRHTTRVLTIAATFMMFAAVIAIPAQEMRPAIPSSGLIGYLASPRARTLRKNSNHPLIREISRLLGEPVSEEAVAMPEETSVPVMAAPDAVSPSCGLETGTRFNTEPRTAPAVAPQNEPTVDFLPAAGLNGADLVVGTGNDTRGLFNSLGDSTTGYYVHRNGAASNPCSPDFEGGLPSFRMGVEMLAGSGDPAVDADPARNAVFLLDTRMGSRGTSAIGLFRNTADRLNNTLTCPNGTHSGNAANICWNTRTAVSARTDALSIF